MWCLSFILPIQGVVLLYTISHCRWVVAAAAAAVLVVVTSINQSSVVCIMLVLFFLFYFFANSHLYRLFRRKEK